MNEDDIERMMEDLDHLHRRGLRVGVGLGLFTAAVFVAVRELAGRFVGGGGSDPFITAMVLSLLAGICWWRA